MGYSRGPPEGFGVGVGVDIREIHQSGSGGVGTLAAGAASPTLTRHERMRIVDLIVERSEMQIAVKTDWRASKMQRTKKKAEQRKACW